MHPPYPRTPNSPTRAMAGAPRGWWWEGPENSFEGATFRKLCDDEIARFGALGNPGGGDLRHLQLDQQLHINLAEWDEDNIDNGCITYGEPPEGVVVAYAMRHEPKDGTEAAYIPWNHPVLAHLDSMENGDVHEYMKYDCIHGSDYVMASASDTRTCMTKLREELRQRDARHNVKSAQKRGETAEIEE